MKFEVILADLSRYEVEADEFTPGKDGILTFYRRGDAVAYFTEVRSAAPVGALSREAPPMEVMRDDAMVLSPYLPQVTDADAKGWVTIPITKQHDILETCTDKNCQMCNVKEEPNE